MGKSNRVSFIRGKRMRATKVDANGRPVYGDGSVVTTKGYVSVQYTTNTEEGEAVSSTNANGDSCVNEPATPSFTGYGVEIEFCDVDFSMFELITGQELVTNAAGVAIGITESTDVNLSAINFALEVWTGANSTGTPAAGSQGQFGYILTPFLGGGVIGDLTIENGAATFTVSSMSTKNGSGWGKGPHAVELVGGTPALLRTSMKKNDHRRIMTVEVAPPEQYSGSTPLLDPSDTALTAVSGIVTKLSVAFTVTPAGSGGVFYDFGDGTWDYSATGPITHVYPDVATYAVTAKRGSSSASASVTTLE